MSGTGSSLRPGCLLHRRVRTDFDDDDQQDLIAVQPFQILRCVNKAASGFPSQMQAYADKVVQGMGIGVHLADAPSGISCLGLRGASPLTNVEAVDDRGIVVITTHLSPRLQPHHLSRLRRRQWVAPHDPRARQPLLEVHRHHRWHAHRAATP
ncbi:hypothetical protein ZWY2020_019012 [Hordeum vulgare]|nr:hypothetical protein ZWY2020_019012 [Hordeum vulgare]